MCFCWGSSQHILFSAALASEARHKGRELAGPLEPGAWLVLIFLLSKGSLIPIAWPAPKHGQMRACKVDDPTTRRSVRRNGRSLTPTAHRCPRLAPNQVPSGVPFGYWFSFEAVCPGAFGAQSLTIWSTYKRWCAGRRPVTHLKFGKLARWAKERAGEVVPYIDCELAPHYVRSVAPPRPYPAPPLRRRT